MPLHKGENLYIYGLHDAGGEHLMTDDGEAKGWVVVTEAIGSDPQELGGGDYRGIARKNLGLIVRLNNAYGRKGTIPREEKYRDFSQRVASFVEASKGAHIWLIGNEMNYENEQPRQRDSNQPEPITPRRYAECYKLCRRRIKALPGHRDDLVVVGAVAPWNAQTKYEKDPKGEYPANTNGDWIQYLRDVLLAIGPEHCDAIALHAYSHGYEKEKVTDSTKMDPPFENHHYHFYTYRDQMNAIPKPMRHLPVYITEANGDKQDGRPAHEPGATWPFGNNGWIKEAFKEIDRWNKSGKQQIRCLALFRWKKDPLGWTIDGKPEVQQDFKEAVAKDYQWDSEASERAASQVTEPVVSKPGYLVEYLSHNTPTSVAPNQALTVTLELKNAGRFQWSHTGSRPFRLGFQWYDENNQLVSLPSHLDFRTPLPQTLTTGETVELQAKLRTPPEPGRYRLRWDMVHEMVTWFSSQGDPGLVVPVKVTAPTREATGPEPELTAPERPVTIHAKDVTAALAQHPSIRYPMRTHADIKRIIIHHTATPSNISVERIAEFQVTNRELPGIAYHFCVTDSGEVYQTQYLETVAAHAGKNSADSVGVCLIGNFTDSPPTTLQLNATAALIAQLAKQLGLGIDNIFGYSEIVVTQSPGATWPQWKKPLLTKVSRMLKSDKPIPPSKPGLVGGKTIEHYMLFWYRNPDDWAEWDLQGALDYIARFRPAIGFDIEEAKSAKYVTLVGDKSSIPPNAERVLQRAGCKVERIAGKTEAETRQILQELVSQGKRFLEIE